jgi:hypothetical protein
MRVAGGDADDLATTTVTIKGLRNGATITDNLDSTVAANPMPRTTDNAESGISGAFIRYSSEYPVKLS